MFNHFRRELIFGLAFIGGGIVVFTSAIYFFSQDLESRADKVVSDRTLINQRAAALGALADLKRDSPPADIYKRAMDKILVSQDQLLDFPRWLDGLARVRRIGLNFSFQGNQIAPGENAAGYVAFSLDLIGKLDDLVDFLKDVEFRSPRFLISLEGIDLTRNGTDYRILSQGKVFFK